MGSDLRFAAAVTASGIMVLIIMSVLMRAPPQQQQQQQERSQPPTNRAEDVYATREEGLPQPPALRQESSSSPPYGPYPHLPPTFRASSGPSYFSYSYIPPGSPGHKPFVVSFSPTNDPCKAPAAGPYRYLTEAEEEAAGVSEALHHGLVSFPRSGNTWVRTVFQETTGIFSGSVYDDQHAPPPLEHRPGTEHVYLVKSHALATEYTRRDSSGEMRLAGGPFRFSRAVHLVRNPFDSVWSLVNKIATNTFNKSASPADIPAELLARVPSLFLDWAAHWEAWGAPYPQEPAAFVRPPTLTVRYEDLHADPYPHFAAMFDFLGVPFREARLRCAIAATACERAPLLCRSGEVGGGLRALQALRTQGLDIPELLLALEGPLHLLGYSIATDPASGLLDLALLPAPLHLSAGPQ